MNRLILIVDDNLECAEPLQIALESLTGFDVEVAGSPQAALRSFSENAGRLAAVITDVRMPLVNGFELLASLRQDAALRAVPVVLISGDSEPGLPERALNGGASAFFSKPYSPLQVRRRLEELLA